MNKKKSLRVLVIALAVVMVFVVCSTAMASPREWHRFSLTQKGQSNNRVMLVQRMLFQQRYLTNLTDVDGVFGTNTDTQVKNFQGNHGRTRDGIVGANTWSDLEGKLVYSSRTGYGTGLYSVTFRVNGTECVKMWSTSRASDYQYDWDVLSRFGNYERAQTIISTKLIQA